MSIRLVLACTSVAFCVAKLPKREPWVKIQGTGLLQHWASSVVSAPPADWKSEVTPQLLITSRADSFLRLPQYLQDNVASILSRSAGVRLRWMGDKACRAYLQAHYDRELASIYLSEEHGPSRRSLCRTAVLLREGGFSTEVDVELTRPLGDLVHSKTTFMSVFSEGKHAAHSSLLAAKAGSPVLEATLSEIRKWYRYPDLRRHTTADQTVDDRMGPLTLLRGIRHAVREKCPGTAVDAGMSVDLHCGDEVYQFHRERNLDCKGDADSCRAGRASSPFKDHRIGLFASHAGVTSLIGWPRGAFCVSESCAEEIVAAVAEDSLHAGSAAFWPLMIGTACFLLVMPNLMMGFQDLFSGAHDIMMGPRFRKGMK